MPLNLYRRHRPDCEGGHAYDSRSGEFEERKKAWKQCACPIYASGTLSGKFRRQSTISYQWDAAKAVVAGWEVTGTWGVPASEAQPKPEPKQASQRITIAEATEAFLAKCQNRGIRSTTYAKYKTFSKQLKSYAEDRGYLHLDQLTISDMDRFYAGWKDGKRAKAKKLERLKAFVKFCLKREWIAKDITDDLEAPQGASIPNHKSPFTDDELKDIFDACDQIGPAPGPPRRTWGGEDAKDFILLSIYTGLRISDVATFDVTKRLDGNNVFLRTHKTGTQVLTWIPDWLVQRLRAREKKYGSLIFTAGVTRNMKQLTDIWRNKRLAHVFDLAGPFEEPPHPHRLRHTFVRILLEKGVPDTEVANLIGDTVEILRKHYSKWLPGRQERTIRILQDAFRDKPKIVPKLG
ncbi:MAG TPA: site-specific integrase [Bryobacteraceae bacterium]|nr:site-specific integrase [Bryobacteraceae bacterium]